MTVERRVMFWGGMAIALGLAVLALVDVVSGIWLPDALAGRTWRSAGRVSLRNGQELELMQKRDGVFYYTALFCRDRDGNKRGFLLGIDEPKIWRWKLYEHPSQDFIAMSLGPGRVFTYNWVSGELRSSERDGVYTPRPAPELEAVGE